MSEDLPNTRYKLSIKYDYIEATLFQLNLCVTDTRD